MKRPEILSPAGDLERLKFAVLYGADAVYVGATEFGMRSAPKNFTMEQLGGGRALCPCQRAPGLSDIEYSAYQ